MQPLTRQAGRVSSAAPLSGVALGGIRTAQIVDSQPARARSMATGPAASPTVVSDELLAKLGSLSTQV